MTLKCSAASRISSVTGFDVSKNTFSHLRQPAYINAATGTVSSNETDNTKGWVVVSDSSVTFTNNTWGTNVEDIAIIQDSPAGPNNYPDTASISAANNNAQVENQTSATPSLSDVYVDGSVATTGNGLAATPYKTIAEAMPRVVAGGTVHVAKGVYNETVTIDKSMTLLGAQAGTAGSSARAGDEADETVLNTASGVQSITITTPDMVTVSGFTFDATGIPVGTVDGGAVTMLRQCHPEHERGTRRSTSRTSLRTSISRTTTSCTSAPETTRASSSPATTPARPVPSSTSAATRSTLRT